VTIPVAVAPVGPLPVSCHATAPVPERPHRAFALRAVPIATGALPFFLAAGRPLREASGLRFGAVRVAGGPVPFLVAVQTVFGEAEPEQGIAEAERVPGAAGARGQPDRGDHPRHRRRRCGARRARRGGRARSPAGRGGLGAGLPGCA
jgi:hypothetical protein